MLGLLGKKLGSTRVYDDKGVLWSVTVVLAGPNRVLQCKTQETDGYNSVQLGFDDQKDQRVTKPLLGHIKKHNGAAVKRIREFRDFPLAVKPGDDGRGFRHIVLHCMFTAYLPRRIRRSARSLLASICSGVISGSAA